LAHNNGSRPPDHEDYEPSANALKLVADVVDDVNRSITESEDMLKLIEAQHKLRSVAHWCNGATVLRCNFALAQ
jgi:hypothetical protein